MSKVFLFALTAAFNPTLLTATTVMLLLPNPKKLMLGYLTGAFTTGMVVGFAIVEWMSNSGALSDTKSTVAPGIDFALGGILLVAAYVVHSGYVARRNARREANRGAKPKKTPRWQQALSGGSARTTFVIGLLLSFPGASYLTSLTELAKQNLGTTEVVLTLLAVQAVMLMLLEIPLICFAVAPEWTPLAIGRFKAWIATHGATALVWGLTIAGGLLILRAIVTIVA